MIDPSARRFYWRLASLHCPPMQPASRTRQGLANWLVPIALACLLLALQAGGASVYEALRYERATVRAGEPWRLATAHFVHLGWTHCLLNVAGLAVCAVFAGGARSPREWLEAIAALAVGVGASLMVLSPRIADYAGLSGVLYGLFVWVLAVPAWRGDLLARVALAFVLGRFGWQMFFGPSEAQGALIGGEVVAEAHLYGAAWAFALVGWEWLRARRRRST